MLPYHNDDLNAAKWLAEIEMRWPSHGEHRDTLPLFSDEAGEPFTDSRFAGIIMAALTLVLGPERAALFSPHSWRVWLASALRMAGAPDPLIQALGRWMNPESIKIYARLGTEEYKHWIDKMMTVTHIDATRTTNLPPLDQADVLRLWWEDAGGATARQPRTRDDRIEKSTQATPWRLGHACPSSGPIWTHGSRGRCPKRGSSRPTTAARNRTRHANYL